MLKFKIQYGPRLLYLVLLMYTLVMVLVVTTAQRYIKRLPPISTLERYTPSLITRIFDVRGELIAELFEERRSVIPLPDIPLDFQRAMIAIEDNNFYTHWGIDLRGIMRATWANFKARRTVQGGSTITQQLAKNIFLTRARTFDRKIKELLLTLQIEKNFSKDEILQLYVNQIYFGTGAYGIEAAAKAFFDKTAQQLNLAECALLAGLPKAPLAYSPFKHPRRALKRRSTVLRRMRDLGFITEREELQALTQSLDKLVKTKNVTKISYFVEHVRLKLEPKYGADMIYRGGLSIHTSLDIRMQKIAEELTDKHLQAFDDKFAIDRMEYLLKNEKITEDEFKAWEEKIKNPDAVPEEKLILIEEEGEEDVDKIPEPQKVQGALVAIDPRTGGIRAMIGGRNFQESQFNRATQAKRQPGSTFKPFVWLAALESGFTAATLVDDYPLAFTNVTRHPKLVAEATNYMILREMLTSYYLPDMPEDEPDPIWAPRNWDDKYFGPVTLRKGLAWSRNLVSVRLIDRVGPRTVVNFAKKAGIETPLEAVLSLGLGTSVVTPLGMASAFSTFANNGVHMKPFSIQRVIDHEGRILENHVVQGEVAFSPQTAYLVTRLLQAVVQEGTGRRASRLRRPTAGKTGTTQGQRDVWFLGYLPDLATGVWIGYDDFLPLGKKITSSRTSVPWWTEFMQGAGKFLPVRDFQVPPGIEFVKIDRNTGLLALPSCPQVVLEAFRSALAPTEFCAEDHEDFYSLNPPAIIDIEE